MDGGPSGVFDVGSAGGLQDAGPDEVVECVLEIFQWLWLIVCAGGGVVGLRECGVEEAWLCAGEVEVCLADCLESEARASGLREQLRAGAEGARAPGGWGSPPRRWRRSRSSRLQSMPDLPGPVSRHHSDALPLVTQPPSESDTVTPSGN